MGLLPLAGLAGPLFDCVHLHSFICFLGELSLCHNVGLISASLSSSALSVTAFTLVHCIYLSVSPTRL